MNANPTEPVRDPLVRVIDFDVNESLEVELCDGTRTQVRLAAVHETRDEVLAAVADASATVEVDGEPFTIGAGLYTLPRAVDGVQLDCTVTRGTTEDSHMDHWGLVKDARIRLWPAGSPLAAEGTLAYPVRQRWFACGTSYSNEQVAPRPGGRAYLHAGLDIGGADAMTEVLCAAEGLAITSGGDALPGYEGMPQRDGAPMKPGLDIVTVLDDRGWCYRYVHLDGVDPAIRVGHRVAMGQRIGILGKKGTSGGWAHLHFEVKCLQPSGIWGTQEAYAFIHEAYRRQYEFGLMAVAQPRLFAWTGRPVLLDGSRSWSASDPIARHDWTFSDGSTASGLEAERVYDRSGTYSEILKVTDSEGRSAFDFARVTVLDSGIEDPWRSRLLDSSTPMDELLGLLPVRLHPAYHPTLDIHPGDPITFLVRAFHTTEGSETWDFGDGSPPVEVQSDGNVDRYAPDGYAQTVHRYDSPGDYLVRVERTDNQGVTGIAHLHVPVEGH